MNNKKLLLFAFLLTLAATPLLPMEVRDGDHNTREDPSGTTGGSNNEGAPIYNPPQGTPLHGDNDPPQLPSTQQSGLQNRKEDSTIPETKTMDPTIDRSQYSNIPSYSPAHHNAGSGGQIKAVAEPKETSRSIDYAESFIDSRATSPSIPSRELAEHHIRAVSTSPGDSPDPILIASISGKIDESVELFKEMRSLEKTFSSQKVAIGNEGQEKIEQAQQKAELTQSRAFATGVGSSLVAGRDAETTKKNAIKKINTDAVNALSAASFGYAKEALRLQSSHYNNLLQKRYTRRTSTSETVDHRLPETQILKAPETRLFQALELKGNLLSFLQKSPPGSSPEDLELACQSIRVTDAIVAITFTEGADSEIAHATAQLEKTSALLTLVATRDLPEENDFSSHELIQELRGLCKQNYAEFQFAKIESDKGAGVIAEKNTYTLLKKAQELRGDSKNRSTQIPLATEADKKNLEEESRTLNELASVLEMIALAYDQIADLSTVELREIPQLKENLKNLPSPLRNELAKGVSESSSTDTALGNTSNISREALLHDLSSLLEQTDLTRAETRETFGLDILSQLKEITGRDEHILTASNENIALSPIPSPLPVDINRQSFIHATHLIRLAIFREFGSHGLQRFDKRFTANIQAKTPITVGELKEFLQKESTKYKNPSSYFIGEHHAIEELLNIKQDSPEAQKIIKADGSSIVSFNPFLTSSTARETLADETGSVQRGVEVAKTTLKNFLEKAHLLDPVQIQTILRHFDTTFDATNPEKQLTVGALKTFTENELGRALTGMTFVEWLSASPRNPGANSIIWRMVTAGTLSLLTSSPHLSALIKFFILVSEQATSDQTFLWRARPGASAGGGH